jgi:hypothetical protein
MAAAVTGPGAITPESDITTTCDKKNSKLTELSLSQLTGLIIVN